MPNLKSISGPQAKTQLIRFFFGLFTFIAVVVVISPILWMVRVAFTPRSLVFVMPPSFRFSDFSIAPMRFALGLTQLQSFFLNTLIVSLGTVFVCVVVGTSAAYSFSRFRYPGRKALMILTLSAQMFPWALLLITLYMFFLRVRLLDTYIGLILSHTTFALPLTTWILKGYFDTVPFELEQASYIDGCSRMQSLWYVVLPVAKPGIVAAAIYIFIFSWNDFLFGLTLTTGPSRRTLAAGLAVTFVGEFQVMWSEMMSAALLTSAPVILLFFLLQKSFVDGLTAGALKN